MPRNERWNGEQAIHSTIPAELQRTDRNQSSDGPSVKAQRRVAHKPNSLCLRVRPVKCGQTPWVPPSEMADMGFSMILYPTTLLFRLTKSIQRGLADLLAGKPLPKAESFDMSTFERLIDMQDWELIEKTFKVSQRA